MSDIIEASFVVAEERSLDAITAEIITITRQTQTMILHSAIEVGRRLCEAKERVPHGEWGNYLRDKVDFSPSSANNFMRVFKEYGDNQISLFGDAKSQTFGNLSYSKAVALFAVPEDEREQFVAENNVEEISVAELKKLIAERDRELADAKKNEQAAKDNMEQLREELSRARREADEATISEQELENIRLTTYEEAEKAVKAASESELKAVRETAEREKNKLVEKAAKLDIQLKKAKANTEAEVKKAIEAERAKVAELEKQLADAQSADSGFEKQLLAEKERAAELEKKLKLTDADSTRFKLIFEQFQEDFNKLMGLLNKVQGTDGEKAAKLKAALTAMVKNMGDRLV